MSDHSHPLVPSNLDIIPSNYENFSHLLATHAPCTILVSARQIPEGHRHRLPVDPLPVLRILLVPRGSKPVLTISVAPVPPPELPAEEALQGGVGLVHEGAAALRAEVLGLQEVAGLVIIEDVALSIVRGGAAGSLVPAMMDVRLYFKLYFQFVTSSKASPSKSLPLLSPECGAALYGERLVSVHERFTDGETHTRRALEMDTHKGA